MSQSTIKKCQASLDSFFKPAQPAASASASASVSASTSGAGAGAGAGIGTPSSQRPRMISKPPPPNFPHPAFSGFRENSTEAISVNSTAARPTTAASQQSHTSSLSPPPTSPTNPYDIPISPPKAAVTSSTPGRVIKSSDDEDEDSESSLEDLATLLQSNRSKPPANGFPPSTPSASRTKNVDFHISPMPILNKHKFDLKSLATHAEIDRKTEASSKRVKAMQEARGKKEELASGGITAGERLKHSSLLQAVVAEKDDADVHKVARAVMRTEATLSEQRWYFFDTQSKPSKGQREPFPTKSIPSEWKSDLKDAQVRNQTFVSGFAEDMVSVGKGLPDEIFLWILDEICVESSEALRTSYCNVVKQSPEQVHRLVVPTVIRNMFKAVGATSATTATTDKVRPVQAISELYAQRDWSKLRSLIWLLGQIAKSFQAKTYAVTLLLRTCIDRLVMENVDIFDLVQEAIHRLCRFIPDDSWESNCQTICTTVFNFVDRSTLRLQMVGCIPSTSPRTHDLKRRLAMSFYFNNICYSTKHSHLSMDLEKFLNRLDDPDFDTDAETDYRELAALISLLDIALDDGRSLGLDLKDRETAEGFDKNIDDLAGVIKGILNSIGNPGAAFISRIEAKEVLELVSQRISDTLRTKPKAKITVFDRNKHERKLNENLDKEKHFMASHFSKVKTLDNSASGQV